MKEIIGKTKTKTRNLPWGIVIREKLFIWKENNCEAI